MEILKGDRIISPVRCRTRIQTDGSFIPKPRVFLEECIYQEYIFTDDLLFIEQYA
jgi:hypothetical protein